MPIKNKLALENSLERFVIAQDECYETVLNELKMGQKRTHWMWFIFPQLAGLGYSEYSQYYSLRQDHDARAYWNDPILGNRYRECLSILLKNSINAENILGEVDFKKLQSSLTLFNYAIPNEPLLIESLRKFFREAKDFSTIDLLIRPIS